MLENPHCELQRGFFNFFEKTTSKDLSRLRLVRS